MFNLPWYAWLNVIALPCLWAYLMLECAFQSKPRWYRQYTTAALLCCVITIFLYWNPAINALLNPLQFALLALIAPMIIYNLGLSLVQLCATLILWSTADKPLAQHNPTISGNCLPIDFDADDIDLDEDCNDADNQAKGQAIGKLFSSNASLDDSVQNVMTLFGGEAEDAGPHANTSALIAQLLLIGVPIVPPFMLSLRLLP